MEEKGGAEEEEAEAGGGTAAVPPLPHASAARRHVILPDVTDLAAHSFLYQDPRVVVQAGGRITHTLFTGGKFDASNPLLRRELYELMADDHCNRGLSVAINEIHSKEFPFYLDIDMKLPLPRVGDDAIRLVARVCCLQIARCYPPSARRQATSCVVCTKSKTGEGRPVDSSPGLYKYGFHLHWPRLVVRVDQAFQLRACAVIGLKRRSDWSSEFGIARLDWEDVLDEAVYRAPGKEERSGGLRMIGAPKAQKCTSCRKSQTTHCATCRGKNNRCVVDLASYSPRFHVEFGGEGEGGDRDVPLPKNWKQLLYLTSVRCEADSPLTQGYRPYEGCPLVPSPSLLPVGKGKKRSLPTALESDAGKVGRTFATVVESEDVRSLMRRLLVRFSDHYSLSDLSVRTDQTGRKFRTILWGDGSTFCANKGCCHTSKRAYMDVFYSPRVSRYVCQMLCWSRKNVVRQGGLLCADYKSPPRELEADDVRVLSVHAARSTSSAGRRGSGGSCSLLVSDTARRGLVTSNVEALESEFEAKSRRLEERGKLQVADQ